MKSWSKSVTASSKKVYSIWVENLEAKDSASTPVLTSEASIQLQVYIPRYMNVCICACVCIMYICIDICIYAVCNIEI
jgi:hypothetical protein